MVQWSHSCMLDSFFPQRQGQNKVSDFSSWLAELDEQKQKWQMTFPKVDNSVTAPQLTIQMLGELTGGTGIISTGLGAMGFSLPATLGATATNPDILVIDIDGDGSFIMNVPSAQVTRKEDSRDAIVIILPTLAPCLCHSASSGAGIKSFCCSSS
ncbi:unnamed protein product [Sphagnum troendelagicum]|uniref:Thiamine pyrophosphate enzyme TPP-binding domain-containing protein n=1 Tax=Sphagnum troendelagicum TaxID=128251 RepID=A0ABP0TIS4_9BRYO